MDNLPQPLNNGPSALVRAGMYLLVPVAGLLLLPILVLFILAFYLLALLHGARVFVFTWNGKQEILEEELQKPHFMDIQAAPKALLDEPPMPPKG